VDGVQRYSNNGGINSNYSDEVGSNYGTNISGINLNSYNTGVSGVSTGGGNSNMYSKVNSNNSSQNQTSQKRDWNEEFQLAVYKSLRCSQADKMQNMLVLYQIV